MRIGGILWRLYNYYGPIAVLVFLAVEKLYIWMLFALGFLLVTISCNLQAFVECLSERDAVFRSGSDENDYHEDDYDSRG